MDIFRELDDEQQEIMDALDPKELAFANLWLSMDHHGLSVGQCYLSAGYNVKTIYIAAVSARRLLKKPHVWKYCQMMRKESAKEIGLSLMYLDQQLKDIIDGSAFEVMPITGRRTNKVDPETGEDIISYSPEFVCNSDDLPDCVQSSVQSVKRTAHGGEVKMYNRLEAIKLAYQRQGALKETREISGPNGEPIGAPMFEYRIVGGPGVEPPLPGVDDDDT